jgi:hypothetical protein
MKNRYYILALALLLVSGCATQKRFDRMLAKKPELIQKYIASTEYSVERDTTVLIDTVYQVYRDTTTDYYYTDSSRVDTFYQITEKVTVRIITSPEGLNVTTAVHPDTLYLEKIIYREHSTKTERVSTGAVAWNWVLRNLKMALIALLVLAVGFMVWKMR